MVRRIEQPRPERAFSARETTLCDAIRCLSLSVTPYARECKHLINLAAENMKASNVVDRKTGKSMASKVRTSTVWSHVRSVPVHTFKQFDRKHVLSCSKNDTVTLLVADVQSKAMTMRFSFHPTRSSLRDTFCTAERWCRVPASRDIS